MIRRAGLSVVVPVALFTLSLTAMDLAYLQSLYRNASRFENPRRADLESEMKRSLPNP